MQLELYFDKIEKYVSNEMSVTEKAAFEQEVAANTELRQALELYQLSNETVEIGVEDDLREQFRQWSAEEKKEQTNPREAKVVSFRTRFMAFAAAASVLLIVGFFGWNFARQNYSDEALAAGFYHSPEMSSFRNSDAQDADWEAGLKAFENGNYTEASAVFQREVTESPRYAEAQFLLGDCYLKLENPAAASTAFQTVINSNDVRFREKAEWQLALSYLQAGNSDNEFQILLEKIASDSNHSFQRDAMALQSRLSSFWYKIAN